MLFLSTEETSDQLRRNGHRFRGPDRRPGGVLFRADEPGGTSGRRQFRDLPYVQRDDRRAERDPRGVPEHHDCTRLDRDHRRRPGNPLDQSLGQSERRRERRGDPLRRRAPRARDHDRRDEPQLLPLPLRELRDRSGGDAAGRFARDLSAPIVNPDGIVYNETTNSRRRRDVAEEPRQSGSSCRGVDLNRNYDFEWVGTGSSTDPCSDVFRGPSPNSEQEIQALTNFIDAHEFVCWQSYHSVAALVLFPWGYTSAHTPDDATFRVMAAEMARDSGYQTGQPTEVLYNVNGAAFDWGYGRDDLHPKIFGFTTEIGGSGFWPAESERDGLIAENLHSNLYLCQVAGAWLDLVSVNVLDGGNGAPIRRDCRSFSVVVGNPACWCRRPG
ncbi:MAG: M14 family zinc carboxypeptidase [Candidatus Eisenbacteria bacterium]